MTAKNTPNFLFNPYILHNFLIVEKSDDGVDDSNRDNKYWDPNLLWTKRIKNINAY